MLGHHRPASEKAFRWRADDGPFLSIPPSTKKIIKFGPLLTKRLGSAHVFVNLYYVARGVTMFKLYSNYNP